MRVLINLARILQEADGLAVLENQKANMQGSYIIEHFEEVGEVNLEIEIANK